MLALLVDHPPMFVAGEIALGLSLAFIHPRICRRDCRKSV